MLFYVFLHFIPWTVASSYDESVRSLSDVIVNIMLEKLTIQVRSNNRAGIAGIVEQPKIFHQQMKEDLFDIHSNESHWKRFMFVAKKAGIARNLADGSQSAVGGLVEFSFKDPMNVSLRRWVQYDILLRYNDFNALYFQNFHRIGKGLRRVKKNYIED